MIYVFELHAVNYATCKMKISKKTTGRPSEVMETKVDLADGLLQPRRKSVDTL